MNRRFSILLIDDDASLLNVLRQAAIHNFPEASFTQLTRVDEAKNYVASLDGVVPRLVLLDIDFKEIQNGFDLLSFMRTNPKCHSIPIVMLTVSQSPENIIAAYKLGASSFTVKPFAIEDWGEYLRILRLYWLETVTLLPPN